MAQVPTPEAQVQFAPSDFKEYEVQLKLLREHGPAALAARLQNLAKQQGQTRKVDKNEAAEIFGIMVSERLDTAYTKDLSAAQIRIEQEQTPRGDNRPQLTNQNLGVRVQQQQQQYKNPPWMSKMDLAADPKFQELVNQLMDPNVDPKSMTTQFNEVMNKLQDKLQNEYKNRLANRLTPSRPAPKPGKRDDDL
ncbi:MAG: hypothetical protein ACHQJ6_03170 [Candidatus Berkiellales bacterium]